MAEPNDDQQLTSREKARIQRRQRKRETRMVVDNAAVKRVQTAIASRPVGDTAKKKPR